MRGIDFLLLIGGFGDTKSRYKFHIWRIIFLMRTVYLSSNKSILWRNPFSCLRLWGVFKCPRFQTLSIDFSSKFEVGTLCWINPVTVFAFSISRTFSPLFSLSISSSLFSIYFLLSFFLALSLSVFISFFSSRPLSLYSPHFIPPSLISHSFDLCLSSFPPFYLYLSFTSHFQSGHKNQQCSAMHT